MQQLTNLDASFLHIENDHSPMHVGGVMIFAAPNNGQMTFKRLRKHVAARLQTARVFRQRLVMPAWHLDAPWWVEDEHFCLDDHLSQLTLVEPLSNENLQSVSADFFSRPLSRERPLWELLYVEPAASGRGHAQPPAAGFALLLKVHHAALDGVSAEAVLAGLLDDSPTPRTLPKDDWLPEPVPSLPAMALHRLGTASRWQQQTRELWRTGARLGQRFLQRTVSRQERSLPYYFLAPRTPFNVRIGQARTYCSAELSLSRIKQIKNCQPGLTVNDVVLAICAGATRRYLQDEGVLPSRSLIAMAPISRRNEAQKQSLGNKVSSMLIRLATDIEDPLQRLLQIHENARRAKEYSREMTMEVLLEQLPPSATAHFLSAFAQQNIARHLPPMFNMIITNVPGSPVPLYLDGAMMKSVTGMAGVFDGLALTMVVLSYRDTLSIGITSAPEALQDARRLVTYLQAAQEELARAVLPETAMQAGGHHAEPETSAVA